MHVITLFGRAASDGHFPDPASAKDCSNWTQTVEQPQDTAEGEESGDSDDNHSNRSSDMDEDYDPCLPYPEGPGHSRSSPQALKIMWCMMRHAGVQLFRPNLGESINTPSNHFLWDLAAFIFMRLVECVKFDSISCKMCDLGMVKALVDRYVSDHVMRV